MQIIRTILWVIVTAMLVAFIAMNWTTVPVNIWPLSDGNYLHFEWPVGIVALLFFLLGALPMWLVHRANGWRLKRRIHSLENTVQSTATTTPAATYDPAPVVTHEPPVTPLTSADPDFPTGTVDPHTGRPL